MADLGDTLKEISIVLEPVIPVTSIGLGLVFMGAAVIYSKYITEEHTLTLMGIGATLTSFGGGFLLGRKYEKNKNTYQTKPEDYKIK